MKTIELLVIVALVAVVVALFAWAVAKFKNAFQRRETVRGFNSHMRRKTLARRRITVWENAKRFFLLMPTRFAGLSRHGCGSVQFANVGDGTHEHGKRSCVSDTATATRYLFYEQSATSNECTPALGTNEPLGPSDDLADANALDIPITVKLLGAFAGTSRAISDGTVTNNTRICVAKDGTSRATCPANAAGTFWVVGKAVVPSDTDAGGPVVAGDDFEFIPCFPFQKTY